MNGNQSIAVVGATGAVGREMLDILAAEGVEAGRVRAFASPRSAGQRLAYGSGEVAVEAFGAESLQGIDIALFSAGSAISKQFGRAAAARGTVIIDNSSAFRMDADVPLVVPEINPEALEGADASHDSKTHRGRVIANPNCSTIITLMAATPIQRLLGVKRMVVSTYQAVSGAGAAAMEELRRQARQVLNGEKPTCEVFDQPCAFNVFSHNTTIGEDGYNIEETKMVKETHKIWGDASVRVTATCIRVPVFRAHCASINLTLAQPVDDLNAVREAIGAFAGVQVVDDRAANRFPTPLEASGKDGVLVGRLRLDASQVDEQGRCWGLNLFASGDQLRKGAALNAVQIANLLGEHAAV
ncbi:MAG: aspartate-semialdehyde dehydrogenase [Phycisphaerales bacterium]|nr:aspartate-semialdehyde dehydrogenase [Phycisphaerales bacterium]